MSMNFSFRKTAIVASVAMLSMTMSGVASAESFPVTATVQTTVAITSIVGMNLGTLYANTASGVAAETYGALVLSPAGTMGAHVPGSTADKPLIALGGHVPASATIAVSSTTPVTLTVPGAEVSTVALGAIGWGAGIGALTGDNLVLVSAADPSVAKFQLAQFTVGGVTGGTANALCTNVVDALYACALTPSFGSTALNFKIGATIVTDISSGNTTYQPTTYAG
ncbi:MAG: hypothetical protein U1B30_02665, partial [Pseudomonadota bacterium]|nr:hypothetical protein [Pseudomonadota bacterium]